MNKKPPSPLVVDWRRSVRKAPVVGVARTVPELLMQKHEGGCRYDDCRACGRQLGDVDEYVAIPSTARRAHWCCFAGGARGAVGGEIVPRYETRNEGWRFESALAQRYQLTRQLMLDAWRLNLLEAAVTLTLAIDGDVRTPAAIFRVVSPKSAERDFEKLRASAALTLLKGLR